MQDSDTTIAEFLFCSIGILHCLGHPHPMKVNKNPGTSFHSGVVLKYTLKPEAYFIRIIFRVLEYLPACILKK